METAQRRPDFRAMESDDTSERWGGLLPDWPVMFAIAALCLMSRYWLSSHFGLYEDDYFRIPTALTLSVREIPAAFLRQLISFRQGRPLHGGFVLLFAGIGARLHGLQGAYWMGYCL